MGVDERERRLRRTNDAGITRGVVSGVSVVSANVPLMQRVTSLSPERTERTRRTRPLIPFFPNSLSWGRVGSGHAYLQALGRGEAFFL